LAHLHDAIFHLHFMDFDGGEIRRAASQTVGSPAVVVDDEVPGADVGAFRSRAGPGLIDCDVAGLEFLCERRPGADGKREGEGER